MHVQQLGPIDEFTIGISPERERKEIRERRQNPYKPTQTKNTSGNPKLLSLYLIVKLDPKQKSK